MTKNIIILILGFIVWFAYNDEAHSVNQENQYCDIKTTLIRTVDKIWVFMLIIIIEQGE